VKAGSMNFELAMPKAWNDKSKTILSTVSKAFVFDHTDVDVAIHYSALRR
jgi:hypothetical protein